MMMFYGSNQPYDQCMLHMPEASATQVGDWYIFDIHCDAVIKIKLMKANGSRLVCQPERPNLNNVEIMVLGNG